MKVKMLMSSAVITVNMDDSLLVIKEIFDHFHFHHLLVVCNDELMGVISDRDLLAALSPALGTAAETTRDLAVLNKKAHQILTRKPQTLHQESSIFDAIDILNHHSISCVPIVNDNGKPVGIVTWRDILRFIEERHLEKQHSEDRAYDD